MKRPLFALLASGTIALVACGLDVVGSYEPDDAPGPLDSSAPIDAKDRPDEDASDAPPPPPPPPPPLPCTTTDTTCSAKLTKEGWRYVFLLPNTASACPDKYDATDVYIAPTAQPGACACEEPDQDTTSPKCDKRNNYRGEVSSNAICLLSGLSPSPRLDVDGPDCEEIKWGSTTPQKLPRWGKYDVIQPANGDTGKCRAKAKKNEALVNGPDRRICTPKPECVEDTCNDPSTSERRSCVAKDGEASCPEGFPTKLQAGTKVDLACNDECTCKMEGECSPATLEYFRNKNCSRPVGKITVDGTCQELKNTGGNDNDNDDPDAGVPAPAAFRYTAKANFKPVATPPTPKVTPSGKEFRTICCR